MPSVSQALADIDASATAPSGEPRSAQHGSTTLIDLPEARVAELEKEVDALRRKLHRLERAEHDRIAQLADIRDELHQASRVQRNLQAPTPAIRGGDLFTLHRPVGIVSGDLIEVTRLDDRRVGIALADACGHGVPAGMLGTFVRLLLRDIGENDSARHAHPDAVLRRINEALLATQMDDGQFITALYAVYDEEKRTLRWARGGAPYPILIPRGQPARIVSSPGPLLGAIEDARFDIMEIALQEGDTVMFHTDGLEALLFDNPCGEIDHHLQRTPWLRNLGRVPITEQLAALQGAWIAARESGRPLDDLTVVALLT